MYEFKAGSWQPIVIGIHDIPICAWMSVFPGHKYTFSSYNGVFRFSSACDFWTITQNIFYD